VPVPVGGHIMAAASAPRSGSIATSSNSRQMRSVFFTSVDYRESVWAALASESRIGQSGRSSP